MKRFLLLALMLPLGTKTASAAGLLIPEEKKLPPLAMLNHQVMINIQDQVAVTKVEQTFRNHTARQLEATYLFPVPEGASVNGFSMEVNGKEVKGELVEAKKAREIYTSIVRRTQDPGLLEYMDHRLFRLRVFPIPPNGDQKVSLTYTSVAEREKGLVEYVYPLRTKGKATETLESFSITANIRSKLGVQNIYSPTHSISFRRTNDKEVTVHFDKEQGLLDKDFQLFYQLSDKDVGLTAITHRPVSSEDGYFLMLITPQVEMAEEHKVPRDMVLVLDTSGSMRGEKMVQAKKALQHCLDNLTEKDRFAVVNFATTVNKYRRNLTECSSEHIGQAKRWIDRLSATGGTAIHEALLEALSYRTDEEGRTFTVVFFTDGLPTIGEIKPEKIMQSVLDKRTDDTRIFTVGVGDDVNASMLDQLAEKTRALTTYVRPSEDINMKVGSLFAKISHPVLANLRLETTAEVSLNEVYPAQLPDLFHGSQLTVLGRYHGDGPTAIRLIGTVGKETKEFVYEMSFPRRTEESKELVEDLWARRKVGYLLDQIRLNGEKKELVEEVTALAKRYAIVTPYTSHLIVPDGTAPVVRSRDRNALPDVRFNGIGGVPTGLKRQDQGGQMKVEAYGRIVNAKPGQLAGSRGGFESRKLTQLEERGDKDELLLEAKSKLDTYRMTTEELRRSHAWKTQQGKLGVDLSIQTCNLRNQSKLEYTAQRRVNSRTCMEVGGVWVDEEFHAKTPAVTVRAQSAAYFRILEKQPKMKDVFKLGNHLVWVAPNGTALVIDTTEGKEKMSDQEIDELFVARK